MELSFFGEMAWKSALIAGAALGLAYVLRSRAAADRALVLKLGVAMLLLLPFIALALPALPIEAWAAPDLPPPVPLEFGYAPGAELAAATQTATVPEVTAPTVWDDPTPLVLLAYLGGLAMVGSRLLVGLFMLSRWSRGARPVDSRAWQDAFERARWSAPNGERVRLLVSDEVPSPLSWGWLNPVILIDPDTLADDAEADAILAHEMAHIARRDWPVLMSTRVAAALFWFNPLVWLLEREVVQQAEEAADAEAARAVEPIHYAKTLLSLAQVNGRQIPANSIAPSGSALARRVKAILDRSLRERPSGSAWTKMAAILCIGIAVPVAALQLVEAANAQEAPEAPDAPQAPDAPDAAEAPDAPDAPSPPHALTPLAPMPPIPDVAPIVNEALAEVLPRIPHLVAEALTSVDPDEIEREIEAALREARPEIRRISSAEMRRVTSEVRRALQRARAQAAHAPVAIAHARRAAAAAPQMVRASMARGSEGMERGAEGMERGARQMEEEARRLGDRDHREQLIARERARGHNVTHEELIEAAEGLREGAEGMREGARGMREAAREMRDGRHD
jgi:bla regulator protein blaR1